MSIKDKIEKLPSGYAIPAMESYKRFSNLSVSDLKALSDSHTALLELLKNRGNDYTSAEDGEIWRSLVKAAIEEAEKL